MSEAVGRKAKPLPVLALGPKSGEEIAKAQSYAELLNQSKRDGKTIESLEKRVQELEAILADKDAAHEKDVLEAVEKSREDAFASVTKDNTAIEQAVSENLVQARKKLETFLDDTEALALELVGVALESLFSKPENMKATLAGMIGKVVDDIGRTAIVSLRVSREDFGCIEEFFENNADLMSTDFVVEIDPILSQGECIFELLVGTYELSLSEHWKVVKAFLEQRASASAAASGKPSQS